MKRNATFVRTVTGFGSVTEKILCLLNFHFLAGSGCVKAAVMSSSHFFFVVASNYLSHRLKSNVSTEGLMTIQSFWERSRTGLLY